MIFSLFSNATNALSASWIAHNDIQSYTCPLYLNQYVADIPYSCRDSALEELLWYGSCQQSWPKTEIEAARCRHAREAKETSSFFSLPCLDFDIFLNLSEDILKISGANITEEEYYESMKSNDVEIPSSRNICFIHYVGGGTEAEVWKICDAQTGTEVAMKIFRRTVEKKHYVAKQHKKNAQSFRESTVGYYIDSDFLLKPKHVAILPPEFLGNNVEIESNTEYIKYFHSALIFELASMDLDDLASHFNGELTEEYISCIGYKILKGIIAMYDYGLIWMDCKPRNILVFGDYQPKLSDLSFVHKIGDLSYAPPMGTPLFRAPEFIKAGREDKQVYITGQGAVFAFGVTLFELAYNKYIHMFI
eukprot:GHVP01040108.1.p1 GENE.GHVP01040108.1~~GHVP01040108.1.p1  ORF type:complete len:362 (-),score=63.19 GHVP01040108.1:111-1196(-)